MVKKGIIFCDVDGTLCFHDDLHGVRVVERNADGTVRVTQPGSDRRFQAFDLSDGKYSVYMALETYALCHRLRKYFDMVPVTGGRIRTMQRRRKCLDFADAMILENGGVITGPDFSPDEGWAKRFQAARDALMEVSRRLDEAGWKQDNLGRTTALRVRHRDNPGRSKEEFDALPAQIGLPATLQATSNLNHLDIIPFAAGKETAIEFVAEKRGFSLRETIGIGDDLNDIAFLRVTGAAYVLSSAFPGMLEEAGRQGWRISKAGVFEGIHEILSEILASAG